jgi:hypothetical protein
MRWGSGKSGRASIAAMPKLLRPIVLALILAAVSVGLLGCSGDDGPDPSIPGEDAQTLLGQIQEIQANVDVDSPCVGADRTDNLIADIQELPSSVNSEVRRALENGANNLKLLLSGECESRTETTTTTETEPTTTEETTTERTEPTTTERTQTQQTTTTETQTQPNTTTTPGASGGIGPGGL